MAIEPIGSMTAVQMQSTVKVQPVQKTEADNKDVILTDSAVPKIDEVTSSVAKTAESNTSGDGNNERENTASENEAIKRVISDMNKKAANSEAVFGIHEGTNRITIKIVDKETKKVIKELPPEKTLDMIAKVWEMAGLLVDEKR